MPARFSVTPDAGKFDPETYATWRATSLGDITEALERRVLLRLAGDFQGRHVLDVGCGDGALALACWNSGAAQVAGLDLDARMVTRAVALAAQHQATIGYTVGRADTLPFCDKSFDRVVSVAMLTFVPEADRVVREMARVLRPGGRLVIGDLGKWSIWAARRRVRAWLGSPTWRAARFRTAGELLAMARQAGLSVGRVQGAIFFPPCTALARVIAPIDARLGQLTTLGAAFVAIQATKSR
jgi:2-polyprenyl-3-methyl-5-hydroxy-6-metoxy-1,4-benzoquinol methylase